MAKAKEFQALGADSIHLVDLDGAKAGYPINHDIVKRVKSETGLFAEVGGGIRKMEEIEMYLEAGVGSGDPGNLRGAQPQTGRRSSEKYGKNIAVGIDAKDGMVAIEGWEEKAISTL